MLFRSAPVPVIAAEDTAVILSIVAEGSSSQVSKELLTLSRRSESVGDLEDNFIQDDSRSGSNYLLARIVRLDSRV